MLQFIGKVNGAFTATSGTIACGHAERVNLQIFMDTNNTYEVAVLPTKSAAGTASKSNCAAILSDNGTYECKRIGAGVNNWYLAYRVYSGYTAGAGGANDKYALEKLG
jgi:hypothetical protein